MSAISVRSPVPPPAPNLKNEISLTTFSKADIDALDINKDGKISHDEIRQFVANAQIAQHISKLHKRLMFMVIGLLLVVMVIIVGLTAIVVEQLKESHVDNHVMVALDGTPVQCASLDMIVDDESGALTSRSGDSTIRTLSVPYFEHALNSKVPDKYLAQLKKFTATFEGSTHYVQVNSFRRVIDVTAECGSIVALETNLGEFKLDATHLWYHGGIVEVMGSFSKGRKLSAASLVAFYEDVEAIDFECFTEWMGKEEEVEKPSMPALPMTYTVVRHNPCLQTVYESVDSMKENTPTDVCTSTVGANARRTKPGALEGGAHYLITVEHVLVTETEQVTVSYMPNHPLQRLVKVVDSTQVENTGNKTVTQYQLYREEPAHLYCEQSEIIGGSDLSFDSLHYLGSAIDKGFGIRKWAAGAVTNITNASLAVGELDMGLEYGLSKQTYVEFWDTDDDAHLPYYFGVHGVAVDYDAAYYKSVRVGISAEEVESWKAKELGAVGGGHRRRNHASPGDDGLCREGRNQIREGNFWFAAPSMSNAFTEYEADIDFYLQQITNGAAVQSVVHQDTQSYMGYWGLALHSFVPELREGVIDSKYVADTIGKCEELSVNKTMYEECMTRVQPILSLSEDALNTLEEGVVNITDGDGHRRRLSHTDVCYTASNCITGIGTTLADCIPPGAGGPNGAWNVQLSTTATIEFDGIDITYNRNEGYERNGGTTFVKRIMHQVFCYPVNRGIMYSYFQQQFEEQQTVQANQISVRKSSFGFEVAGKSEMLERSSFSQSVTGSGQLEISKNLIDGKTAVSGQGSIKYTASRSICANFIASAAKGAASFSLEGQVGIASNSISFAVNAGVSGSAEVKARGLRIDFWNSRSCKCVGSTFRGDCIDVAKATVGGVVTIKIDNMWCGKTPEVSVIAAITGSLQLGPFVVGVGQTFTIVNKQKIGGKWDC